VLCEHSLLKKYCQRITRKNVNDMNKTEKQPKTPQVREHSVMLMRSAYLVRLQGGNKIIVIADSISEVCDKMESSEFSTIKFNIEHDKTMIALV
jgi:hypothetical protein